MRLILSDFLGAVFAAGMAQAAPVDAVAQAAKDAFARMPEVIVVDRIAGECGATDAVDPRVAYCTTANQILVAKAARCT